LSCLLLLRGTKGGLAPKREESRGERSNCLDAAAATQPIPLLHTGIPRAIFTVPTECGAYGAGNPAGDTGRVDETIPMSDADQMELVALYAQAARLDANYFGGVSCIGTLSYRQNPGFDARLA